MNGVLNSPYFRSRVMVDSFGLIVIMWDAIRTQLCQERVFVKYRPNSVIAYRGVMIQRPVIDLYHYILFRKYIRSYSYFFPF